MDYLRFFLVFWGVFTLFSHQSCGELLFSYSLWCCYRLFSSFPALFYSPIWDRHWGALTQSRIFLLSNLFYAHLIPYKNGRTVRRHIFWSSCQLWFPSAWYWKTWSAWRSGGWPRARQRQLRYMLRGRLCCGISQVNTSGTFPRKVGKFFKNCFGAAIFLRYWLLRFPCTPV